VAFFGAELDRLAVSSLGGWSIVAAEPDVAGLPLRIPDRASSAKGPTGVDA
jgi:hypothetical protein